MGNPLPSPEEASKNSVPSFDIAKTLRVGVFEVRIKLSSFNS